MPKQSIIAAILGSCVADALGVPVEFKSREYLKTFPVTDMIGYGTYNQPPGTWSDDSSLTLCLVDSLCQGYNLRDIGDTFVRWHSENLWTPHGEVFDIGNTTREAIYRLRKGEVAPEDAGPKHEDSNGNGSLMRIMPLAFYTRSMSFEERKQVVFDVSALTHGHIRSQTACTGYIEFAIALLEGVDLQSAYERMNKAITLTLAEDEELRFFFNLTNNSIWEYEERQIRSSGYVIHSLEAALWCLFTSSSYKECVLKAVNLGEDTDTTAAIAGGLAGIWFGYEQIPRDWLDQLARRQDIEELLDRFSRFLRL